VFFGGYYEDAGRFKKALADADVSATFISGDGALDAGFVSAAGAAAEGAILSCPCYFASEASPGAIGEFARAYEELNGTVPGTYSTEGYDAATILMTGIAEGNTDRPSLLDYVEGLTLVDYAISKTVEFEENGNIKAQGIYVFTVKDGEIVLDTATDDL
jgi:branched-chain amino acid transport system substrate-binding protein